MRSQFSFTRPAVSASTSPKTCGCRRTSFACTPRATAARDRRGPSPQEKREEIDLEEQVAELVEQLRVVVRKRRVGDLVGLLDGVRHDRARRLLAVPGTLAAQPLGQQLQLEEGLLQALHAS